MNKNIWDLYKNSERGKKAIELFTFDFQKDDLIKELGDLFEKFNEYLGGSDTKNFFLDNAYLVLTSLDVKEELFIGETESLADYFDRFIDNIEIVKTDLDSDNNLVVADTRPIIKQKDYKNLCAILPEISLILFLYQTSDFIPILFREQFDLFMRVLDVLGIPLPELPAKTDKRGRLLFYNRINNNIIDFAVENELNAEETCACIYDFAFMLLARDKPKKLLPEPTNVWLTGGSKSDYKTFLENPIEGAKSVWTCNEKTKRGDIIVMYVLSPYSCIQSIWRADIDGVYTPFNYYNSRTRATDGILIPHITLKELKAHPYFSKLPITRKNFQGVNGIRFSARDYDELQKLLRDKGFDTSTLPQLYSPDLEISDELKVEKDVEEKVLIPLLKELGYSENDWSRQLSQKAGRTEKAIPDFVFLPEGEVHFQNAPMVIEAKFDMSSNIERMKAYDQALSYARMMRSKILGICDKERLVIFKEENNYFDRFNPVFEKYWQNINDKETFNELKLLIGKEVISQL